MSRFERRQNLTRQPVGSIYSRNTTQHANVNADNNNNNNIQNQQIQSIQTVLQKHDDLLSRLLSRFNDMDSTLSSKIESIVDAKTLTLSEEIDVRIESLKSNLNDVNSIKENTSKIVNNVLDNIVDTVDNDNIKANEIRIITEDLKTHIIDGIKENVLKMDEYVRGTSELKEMVGEMFNEMLNKQTILFDRNSQKMFDALSSIQRTEEYNELKKEFEKEKDNLFYKKDLSNNIKDNITKEVKIELSTKTDTNNIELEIVEN